MLATYGSYTLSVNILSFTVTVTGTVYTLSTNSEGIKLKPVRHYCRSFMKRNIFQNKEIIVIIIIIINCNWVVTHCCGYFTCIQNMKSFTTEFKSGGQHQKHVVATWNLGNRLSICL